MFRFAVILLLSLSTALAAPSSNEIFAAKVTPELQSALKKSQTANIFVSFKNSTSTVLNHIRSERFSDRSHRLNAMHSLLLDHAESSQRNLIAYLTSLKSIQFESLWINNQIYVKGADSKIVKHLASFEEVESIDEEFFASLIEPVINNNVSVRNADYEWGIVKIQAPEAWEEIGNNDGRGIRVATVDTGVRFTHEALKDNFLGDYGWFDPSTSEPFPTDRNGHGTHTTGTIAGGKGVGVAPGSKWMACRGCATSSCSQFDLNRCGQFFACPTWADGTKPDCSQAPHVVSNSWGGGRGATWFYPVLEAWTVAGIIPVFSIGNNGPECNTANSPGDATYVIGVGSTMISDSISSFSSVGPSINGLMKPDISAPGSEVVSAYHLEDDAYRALSGTSMACPHVSGTIALLLTRDPDMSIESIRKLLFENTDKQLSFSGRVCENIPDHTMPNHVFGSGRLNALKSVVAHSNLLKKTQE